MIAPYPDSYDYLPVSPFVAIVINDPLEPQMKRKRSLDKAVAWLCAQSQPGCRFSALIDGAGKLIYCEQEHPPHITGIGPVFEAKERLAIGFLPSDEARELLVDQLVVEMHSRTMWRVAEE